MPRSLHPADPSRRIDDAGRDVVAAAEKAEHRDLRARSLSFLESVLERPERPLRDASIPVEIGFLRRDEALDNGVDSLGAKLLDEAADELREAVECGVRMRVNCS